MARILNPAYGTPGAWMAFDFENYLPDDILTKVDRASMLNSLEIRAPFLDHEICEWAFRTIPNGFRVNGAERKILLKRLATLKLPHTFDSNRKQGFSFPFLTMLADMGQRKRILERIQSSPIFEPVVVKSFFEEKNIRRTSEIIFGLWIFEVWRSHHGISF
jgi:asparagine synthase (glutamine-hydrolysing)